MVLPLHAIRYWPSKANQLAIAVRKKFWNLDCNGIGKQQKLQALLSQLNQLLIDAEPKCMQHIASAASRATLPARPF